MKYSRFLIIVFLLMCSVSLFADKLEHLRTSKKIITVDVISAPYYAIQIAALRLPPKNAEFFNSVDVVREFSCDDGYVRYTVGEYATFGAAARDLEQYRSMGYTDVFVLNLRKVRLTNSPVSGSSASSSLSRRGGGVSSSSPFVPVPGQKYTIQLGAMRFPVYVSEFEGFDDVKEYYMKTDRIYRYCVGLYEGEEALRELEKVKATGYKDAYLVPIEHYAPYQIE
jgi:hypothetical protein